MSWILQNLRNLTYLDLSDNQLTDISLNAFKPLSKLTVLRLRGNLLKVAALPPLKEATFLRELDLSSNALEGPLSPNTVPSLSCLETLLLADNTFASIRRGALSGKSNRFALDRLLAINNYMSFILISFFNLRLL